MAKNSKVGGQEMTEEQLKAVEAYVKHKTYMAAYNKRAYVKAKRTAYNKARWQTIKAAARIAKENGLLG